MLVSNLSTFNKILHGNIPRLVVFMINIRSDEYTFLKWPFFTLTVGMVSLAGVLGNTRTILVYQCILLYRANEQMSLVWCSVFRDCIPAHFLPPPPPSFPPPSSPPPPPPPHPPPCPHPHHRRHHHHHHHHPHHPHHTYYFHIITITCNNIAARLKHTMYVLSWQQYYCM